jgi:Protein of unknown function (DUF2442)
VSKPEHVKPRSAVDLKDIVEAKAIGGYRLHLRFEDGIEGDVDLAQLVDFKGVFEPLRDPAEVAKVRVDWDLGTVCWPNGADLDPDVLYAKVTGESIDLEERVVPPRSAVGG